MRQHFHLKLMAASVGAATLILAGCGGGSSSVTPVTDNSPLLSGVAAIGQAFKNGTVQVKDATGIDACKEASVTTDGVTGAYQCRLKDGLTMPLVIVVSDPSGNVAPLVSLSFTTPVAGQTQTVNVTPLTNAIVAQLAPNGDPLKFITDTASLQGINKATLDTVVANVVQQLQAVLADNGITDPVFNPLTTPFAAGDGKADAVLDQVKVVPLGNGLAFQNVFAPDSAPVAVAGTTPSSATVAKADAKLDFSKLEFARTKFEKCFVHPVAERVLTKDTTILAAAGGPEVTATHADCDGIVHDSFKNNGYSGGQYFYAVLTSEEMTGAKFNTPEVLRYDVDAINGDRAMVNIKYVDKNGFPGSFITHAKRFLSDPDTAARGTDWYLYGNQRQVDVSVKPALRRFEEFYSQGPASSYVSGILVYVSEDGPGSKNANGDALRVAKVTGPGLPDKGLVLAPPAPGVCTSRNGLYIANKTGNTTVTGAANSSNVFRLQRAKLDGSAYANPNGMLWAQASDYTSSNGGLIFSDFTQLKPFTKYTFELYYGSETTPSVTVTPGIVTSALPATAGTGMQWVNFTDASKAYFDPANPLAAATTAFNVSWLVNQYAEVIREVGSYSYTSSSGAENNNVRVAKKGDTSVVVNVPASCSPGAQFEAIADGNGVSRQFQLKHQTTNGMFKDSQLRFN